MELIQILGKGMAMHTKEKPSRIFYDILAAMILSVSLLLAGCGNGDETPDSEIDVAPFIEMARSADCTDRTNRLFLIDSRLVFWDRQGDCPDNSYSYILFADTIDDALCELHDSIGGPVRDCEDGFYREMFDVIVANLDMPDLGLGGEYTVEEILF